MDHPEEAEMRIWQDAVAALISKGATPTEAFDGANILLAAFRRERAEKRANKPAPKDE